MSSGAPVCLLPNQGQVPPSQPGKLFPAIPKAQDLPSALQAINSLTLIVRYLTAPSLPSFGNNLAPFTPQSLQVGLGLFGGQTANAIKAARFVEVSRSTEKVKVVNPDDNTSFVIVERINSIVFQDRLTGSLLVWAR